MYLQYRDLKLIQISGRLDDDNNDIMNGVYDNSEQPLTREERLKMIFSDWQNGDILVIADSPLKYPKKQGNTLVEMTREEICESGDLSILTDGEVYQDGKIIYKEKPEGVKIEWIYPDWVETSTQEEINLDAINKMYDEYSPMDLPSVVKEMELENPDMAEEFLTMLIQLRNMADQIKSDVRTMSNIVLPKPSEELINFKNKFIK